MKEFAHRALDRAQLLGASYADIRIVARRTETVTVRDGNVIGLASDDTSGFGIRVLCGGAWGFASSSDLVPAEIDRIAELAVRLAKASSLYCRNHVDLGAPSSQVARYETPVLVDPFSIPINRKIDLLLRADAEIRAVKGIAVSTGSIVCQREEKQFASTEGAFIEQVLFETGAGLEATAVGNGDVQRRSYPNSVGRHQATMGFELIEELDLVGNAPRIAEEAVQLLTAPVCPSGERTLILDPTQMALQIHESIGHPIELDRVFGMEAAFAGTSFLAPEMRGNFLYASPIVNVVADATVVGGLGTFGYDDEGIKAQRVPLITGGRFLNFLTSRETASRLSLPSNGMMRADSWGHIPLIRMTNINLEPGEIPTLEDLIADTDDGLFMQTNKSWSIDDRRLNFQFGTEIAWEIKHGRKARLLKNASYTGITPRFWASCDGICREGWNVWGTPNCGKGQPMQIAHVGHGASAARFRNVRVGV